VSGEGSERSPWRERIWWSDDHWGMEQGLTGSHVAGDMLRAGEGGLADGAFVVASHDEQNW